MHDPKCAQFRVIPHDCLSRFATIMFSTIYDTQWKELTAQSLQQMTLESLQMIYLLLFLPTGIVLPIIFYVTWFYKLWPSTGFIIIFSLNFREFENRMHGMILLWDDRRCKRGHLHLSRVTGRHQHHILFIFSIPNYARSRWDAVHLIWFHHH